MANQCYPLPQGAVVAAAATAGVRTPLQRRRLRGDDDALSVQGCREGGVHIGTETVHDQGRTNVCVWRGKDGVTHRRGWVKKPGG